MKKIFISAFFAICTIVLCSFTYISQENIYLTDNELVVENDGMLKKYFFDNASFYQLVDVNEEQKLLNYGYRIIFDNNYDFFIETNVGKIKYLQGTIKESNYSIELSEQMYDFLKLECSKNLLFKDDCVDWWTLYNVRDKYYFNLYNKKTQKKASSVSEYYLENMTSSDYYLNNYSPNKYFNSSLPIKYEDGIINIVPKQWFFEVGNHIFFGKEYIITANTIYIAPPEYDLAVGYKYYKTDVVIIDIDISDPRAGLVDSEYNYIDGVQANQGINLLLDVAISNVYYGINVNEVPNLVNDYKIDISSPQIVVDGQAFDYSYNAHDIPYPIYTNLDDFVIQFKDYNQAFDNGFYIDNFRNQIINKEIEENPDSSNGIFNPDYIMAIATAEIAKLAFNKIVPGISTMYDIVECFEELLSGQNKEKNNLDNSSYYTKYQIDQNGELYKFAGIDLPNSINFLKNNEISNYTIRLGTQIICNSLLNQLTPENKYYLYDIGFSLTLYDWLGNPISNGTSIYSYENKKTHLTFINEDTQNNMEFMANIEKPDWTSVHAFLANETKLYIYKVPENVVLEVMDKYGRIIATSRHPYGNSGYLLVNLTSQNLYYLNTYYLYQNSLNDYNIILNYSNIVQLSNNASFVNNTNFQSKIYKLTINNYSCIYSISTTSSQDTDIAVYTSNGQYIGGDDDYYYDDTSDNPNYNALCSVVLTNMNTYYIVVNTYTRNSSNNTIKITMYRR